MLLVITFNSNMDSITELTQMITVRPLQPEEHKKMITCILKLTELVKIAEDTIAKKRAMDFCPPWGR